MGISLNWLKKYVEIEWTPEELAHNLTMAGIAVEGWEEQGNDWIIEMDLTPNRGDCLGLINLAREVAALNGNAVHIPELNFKCSGGKIEDYVKVEIADPDLCKRYAARLVRNVKLGPSPGWMQEALSNSGIRPINNVVDVTNYVMLETNQPLHAFDYALLGEEKRILVRRAEKQEPFTTLDGVQRELDEQMLVITDGKRPVALAGIMGGENTEINDNTTDVLLESANFLASNIRKSSKKIALRSDSSLRFEKGADIEGLIYALDRAAALIQELAGGEIVEGIWDEYPAPQKPVQVAVRPHRVNYLLGTSLSESEIISFLQRLKFTMQEQDGQVLVDIPSYRPDIQMEVDLIEEVARLYGYGNIPASLPYGATQGALTPYQKFRDTVKNIMARNLYEVVNYSFINPSSYDHILLGQDDLLREVVKISNPLSEDQSVMRTLLLPGLLDNIKRNLARKNQNLAFFEMGSVFIPSNAGLPTENLKLGAIVAGRSEINWLKNQVQMDFFFLKGILEDMLCELGIRDYEFKEYKEPAYHPGRSAAVLCRGEQLGIIGEIHPLVRENFDIKERACSFEIDLDKLFHLITAKVMMESITKYPAVERDIAVLVAQDVKASQAVAAIKEVENTLLGEVVVFDVYMGGQVPEGSKSMAFKLVFQSLEKTLTDSEINESLERILDNLKKKVGAVLR